MSALKTEIPIRDLDNLAKSFLPEIIAFFETEEGKKEFEEWKQKTSKNE